MNVKPRVRLKSVIAQAQPTSQQTPLDIARARFGRKFAHEPGNDYLRYPEPVLTRWGRKSNWRNVNPNHKEPQ